MLLFENVTWQAGLAWVVVLLALLGLNELTRRNTWAALTLFVVVPAALTVAVWPQTAGEDSSTGSWFHWVKIYSALAGCLGFMAIRYFPRLQTHSWALLFPPVILGLNMLEAIVRDVQVYGLDAGVHDGAFMNPGVWNLMNGAAGVLNLVTIGGWVGIYVTRDQSRDMIWPDMTRFWFLGYTAWNFSYVYNCVGDHSFYAAGALLAAPLIAALVIRRGAWLQHRAHTLVFWMMFTMSVPQFADSSAFAVQSPHSPAALFAVASVSLLVNIAVAAVHVRRMRATRRNPLMDEIFTETAEVQHLIDTTPGHRSAPSAPALPARDTAPRTSVG